MGFTAGFTAGFTGGPVENADSADRTAPECPLGREAARPSSGVPEDGYWSSSDLAMISLAVMFTPQGGNSFGVKKLSVRSG